MHIQSTRQIRCPGSGLSTLIALIAALVSGCTAGSGEGLDLSGRPLEEGGDVPLAATLTSLQANVFDPFCIVCHSGAAAPLGLRLEEGASFVNLVGAPSRQSGLRRVQPGAPDASYLIQKLEGSANAGEQMPLGGPPLPQTTIDFVRQWIVDGALDDNTAPPGASPRVTSLDPVLGTTLAVLPAQLDIGFDQDIDASTLNASTIELQRSGGDGVFGDANTVTLVASEIRLSTTNARLALLGLTGAMSVDDDYRLTIRGTGPSVVTSIDGNALDGEFTGSLPSGDGNAGGDFVATFDVQALQPTLESIQNNVFTPTCAVSGCHSGPQGGGLPTGMDLTSADASFAALVGVASIQQAATLRVAPSDPEQSYLIQKLEGTGLGSRMPLGGPFLPQADVDVVRTWIQQGASR